MKVKTKVWLEADGHHIIGDGVAKLLTLIDKLGSLRAASIKMKMSYRRAWGAIKKLERNLGFNVIKRTVGGPRGGGSAITPQGRLLLHRYLTLNHSIHAFAVKRFEESFIKPDQRLRRKKRKRAQASDFLSK